MVQVNGTFLARNDLKHIAAHISKDSKFYAKRQVLKTQIYFGSVVPEIMNAHIRQLIEGNYRIIYRIVDEDRIAILTIHHAARDLLKRKII